MNKYIWLDGNMVPWSEAYVHVMTHTLHYGSGAFEGIRCYSTEHGRAIFRLFDHVDRLIRSFSCFGVSIPWTPELLGQAIVDMVKVNTLTNCYIRPILFFGSESLLLSPQNGSVHCAIIALEMDKCLGREAIRVAISSIKRIHHESAPIQSKINGFYVNSILAFHQAKVRGFDEALLLDHEGNVAEGSVANIFFVINGILKTPPSTAILPGITRASIMTIAREQGIQVHEQTLTLHDIDKATEAFFTGTASEVTSIGTIEKKEFSKAPGPITERIKNAYWEVTRGNDARWLTRIPD